MPFDSRLTNNTGSGLGSDNAADLSFLLRKIPLAASRRIPTNGAGIIIDAKPAQLDSRQVQSKVTNMTNGQSRTSPIFALVGAILMPLVVDPAAAKEPGAYLSRQTASQSMPGFREDILPILERKCITCHACYDAPCQLVMSSPEGLKRGANKKGVYDPERLSPALPTRLFVDGQHASDWRKLGFFSVLRGPNDGRESSTSLLINMLRLGRQNRLAPNKKIPTKIELGLHRKNACPRPTEFTSYAALRPHQGMPMATTGLTDREFALMESWVAGGAPIDQRHPQQSKAEQEMVVAWETLLNQTDARSALVARYLFEHLFLAHLYFDTAGKPNFFTVLRSRTPSGQPIQPIAARRPNDDPQGRFYYRLRILDQTIVQKTHITYYAGPEKLERIKTLFFSGDWPVKAPPSYGQSESANPFITFKAIPPKARYQFLLDDAEYFVRSFIRGPVCRGQAATDVIRDQFWVVFQKPSSDPFILHPEYRASVIPLLGLPGQNENLWQAGPSWLRYRDDRQTYLGLRQAEYRKEQPLGPSLSDIWNGDGHYPGAMLTVFRHFDNASVKRGFIGNYPKTVWVMDYAILERSYYGLVVNFDVFGDVAHQLQTRLYFDLIRRESELNYLRFLPPASREPIRLSWYRGLASIRMALTYFGVDSTTPTQVVYHSSNVQRNFADQVMDGLKRLGGTQDPINRCNDNNCGAPPPQHEHRTETLEALRRLAARPLKKAPFISFFPDLTLIVVKSSGPKDEVYSVVRNRAHADVAFILGEELRLEPEKDTLTITPGIAGSYPNFMFRVDAAKIGDFAGELLSARDQREFDDFVGKWGIRRTHPDFWVVLDEIHEHSKRTDPIQAGVLDINRYKNL